MAAPIECVQNDFFKHRVISLYLSFLSDGNSYKYWGVIPTLFG